MSTLHAVHLPCDEADDDAPAEPTFSNEPLVATYADGRAEITATWRRTNGGADYLDISVAGVSLALSRTALGNLADAIATARTAGAK